MLATNGIDLPVLIAFRMMSRLGRERLAVRSSAEVPLDTLLEQGVRGEVAEMAALASRDGNKFALRVWHYHDDGIPGPDAAVALMIAGLPNGA